MKKKIYQSNQENLLQFVCDSNNEYGIDVKSNQLVKRIGCRSKYDTSLISVTSNNIIPEYNVVKKEKSCLIGIHLNSVQVQVCLEILMNKFKQYLNYDIPKTRLVVEVSNETLNKYIDDFYSMEDYLRDIIYTFYFSKIGEIFGKEVYDNNNEYLLDLNSFSFNLNKVGINKMINEDEVDIL